MVKIFMLLVKHYAFQVSLIALLFMPPAHLMLKHCFEIVEVHSLSILMITMYIFIDCIFISIFNSFKDTNKKLIKTLLIIGGVVITINFVYFIYVVATM